MDKVEVENYTSGNKFLKLITITTVRVFVFSKPQAYPIAADVWSISVLRSALLEVATCLNS